jgi:hypothetical protein
MLGVLLTFSALFVQGVPLAPNQGGSVTGVIRTAAGAPAVGVRVMALARPESLKDLATASSFAGLSETDATGRYRLENIPQGRYYIIAGRVDAPTFYPGTVESSAGTVVTVTAGTVLPGMDFVLSNASIGRALAIFGVAGIPAPVIPLNTVVENGGKLPLFAANGYPSLRFSAGRAQIDVPLNDPNVTLQPDDYLVTVANLPQGYAVKSLRHGSVDLRSSPLQLTTSRPTNPSAETIVVTLTPPPPSQPAGARVSGRIRGIAKRSIYLSGIPGTIYSDGSFEFVGVQPGVQTIVTRNNPGAERTLGSSLVVGTRDIPDLELEEISVAPADPERPGSGSAAGNRPPGTRLSPVTVRATVIDADTSEPFNAGKAYLNGEYSAGFALGDDGKVEIPKVLPGKYTLEVFVYGVGSIRREIVLDAEDVSLSLSLGPEVKPIP